MATLRKVELPELPWQIVEGGIKETEGSGHARMDILVRPEDSPEGYGSKGELRGHHSTKAIRNVLERGAQHR